MTTHETATFERLFEAIRRFTFDAPNDEPSGPTEEALSALGESIKLRDMPPIELEFGRVLASLADNCEELCEAASACFDVVDFKGEPNQTPRRSIELDRELFVFHSMQDWVDDGREWYAACAARGVLVYDTIAIDAVGRVVRSGREFRIANEEGTYPITVYALDRGAWGVAS